VLQLRSGVHVAVGGGSSAGKGVGLLRVGCCANWSYVFVGRVLGALARNRVLAAAMVISLKGDGKEHMAGHATSVYTFVLKGWQT